MTLDDLEQIKDILQSDFDEFWNYDILLNELSSSNSKYIVAKNKDNTIVGFAGIKIILDEAELMNIVTKKDMRHFGIASSMLNHLLSIFNFPLSHLFPQESIILLFLETHIISQLLAQCLQ